MSKKRAQGAPKEIFIQMLQYMPIATFDLVIDYGGQGVIIVRRKTPPYKEVWALPGLSMFKGENIDDTLMRIAEQELGIQIDTANKILLGQFVGKFKTEYQRQDISTGYLVNLSRLQSIKLNEERFYSYRVTKEIPNNMGAMYKFYLGQYFSMKS